MPDQKFVTPKGQVLLLPDNITDAQLADIIQQVDGGISAPAAAVAEPAPEQAGFFSRLLGPTAEQWNPLNILKGVGQVGSALFQGAAENLSASAADPMRLVSPPSQADIEAKQALAGDLAKGVATPFIKGYEKFQQGDYAGAAGEAIALGSSFAVPAVGNPVLRAAIKGTKLNKLPAAIAKHGINPTTTIEKNFPGVDVGQAAVRHGVATKGGARRAGLAIENKLQQEVANVPGSVDALDMAIKTSDRVAKEGRFEGRGAFRNASFGEINKSEGLVDRYLERWEPQNYQLSAQDLLEEKRGTGDLSAWSRDRLGDTTESNVSGLWNQSNSLVAKEELDNLARQAGMPSTSELLRQEQELIALQHALTSGGRTNTWGERMLALTAAGGGAGYGAATGSFSNAIPYLVAAGLISGTRSPALMSALGIGLDRTGRAAISKPSLFGAGQLGSLGREEQ
jgi:hypothetical protein